MTRPGPKPVPTRVLELRGSWRANHRAEEPRALPAIPPMPKELDTQGRKIWRGLTKDLATIGLLASIDQHALARYIQLYQHWRQLHAFIVEHGETEPIYRQRWIDPHRDDEGTLIPGQHERYVAGTVVRPQAKLWLALADRLLRLEQQFGMTPSGRAAIGILLAGAEHYADSKEPPNPKRFLDLG